MNGKSLLDVGCALGYFCFEAEERGASPIVGIELKEKRFKSANILKKIRGSNVKFIKQDIIQEPIEDKFDYVLCLNIIHHLLEPIKIIRQLAYITKDTLVIEFPTFSDQKYRKHTLLFTPWFYNRMPLIGVSSLTKFDQTFIFSPKSIKKILLNHEPLFKKVKIVQSPIKGRMIAICKK
jgi:SAM-dependent methyltransferase